MPEYVGKAKGLQAAEKRLATQIKIGKGGVLGGSSVAGRNVREVLAEVSPPPSQSLPPHPPRPIPRFPNP